MEWLAFNASVRRTGERMAICPFCRGVASSEAESTRSLEGRLATLERGGDDSLRGAVEGLGVRPSSEAGIVPRVRGGLDGPHCVRGPRIGLL